MTTTCPRCSHVNPADASYCHYDGASLANRAAGPVDMARQAFPMPFVFPSGRTCRNFDELAQACVQGWAEAGELLVKGYFKPFFSSVGRIDLAMAAEQAASFPDRDRGVDALVSRLPSVSVKPPRLRAVKTVIDLGTLKAGQDRSFQIELTNDSNRLVFGSLAAAGNWLAPAAATADAARLVQFRQSLAVPMVVRGQHLRAGTKPLETDIVVETNAGTAVIHVTAQVPVVPFADGALAGARTPRDIAEKAKRAPKEAAALFESGAVFHWYQANGWTYPVQGPSATGVGAIQQFFEALGLTKPPKVQVGVATVRLRGSPGEVLHQQIR